MKNILEYLERSARRFPDRISFADPEKEVTYAGLLARARRIGTAVARLKEYGYIDDLAYAKLFFEYGFEKRRGKDRIARELAGKGVMRDLIDEAYAQLEQIPDEEEMAFQLAEQVIREANADPAEMTYEEKQKLQARIVRRLAGRGFSGSVCYRAARETVK